MVVPSGATNIICAGEWADEYEDAIDALIVASGVESQFKATVKAYSFADTEEALNLAVCLDEHAIVIAAPTIGAVLPVLRDFGMENDRNSSSRALPRSDRQYRSYHEIRQNEGRSL